MDYYKALGVAKDATQQEIKQSYRRLASKHHPDRGGSTEEFQKIEEAYRTLSDEDKRRQYDNPSPFGGGGMPGGKPGGFEFNFGGPGFNNPFEDIFRQFNQPRQRVYTVTIFVTLEKVAQGAIETIQVQTPAGPKTFQITIPRGIEDGQRINYEHLMADGVLQIMFRIHRDHRFERRGLDLYSTVEISVIDLILGTTISVTTINDQKLEVVIKPNTKPGAQLRIPNHGLESSNGHGDQYVLISATIPDTISTELLTALQQERNKNKG
jgi:DnaJ-class molecular chaperone